MTNLVNTVEIANRFSSMLGKAGKPLSDCQQRRKRRLASPRGLVVHVFAGLAVDFKQESRSVTSRQKGGG